jgi:hypothetical protein
MKNGKKEILLDLNKVVSELVDELDMKDWKVDVKYAPRPEETSVAEVSYNVHKEADITVFEYRPEYVRNDLRHELLHCKVGLISKMYDKVIDAQRDLIDDLKQKYEELVVDDLERLISRYNRRKPE